MELKRSLSIILSVHQAVLLRKRSAVLSGIIARQIQSLGKKKEKQYIVHFNSSYNSAFQAMECQNHIEQNFVGKQPIECLPNKMNVEVRHSLINKGSVVNRVVAQNHTIDFVLCVGDDKTDEDMFRTLERIQASGTEVVQFIVIVGSHERKTLAKWRLESSTKFLDLLNLLLQE